MELVQAAVEALTKATKEHNAAYERLKVTLDELAILQDELNDKKRALDIREKELENSAFGDV